MEAKELIKASELRIGNFFRFISTDSIEVVADIRTHGLKNHVINNVNINDVEPIQLSEEWHNKFGSKKNGFKSFEYSLKNKLNLCIIVVFNGDYVMLRQGYGDMDDDVVSIWNKDKTRRDMYVHEWQNLFYALSGEELTFND